MTRDAESTSYTLNLWHELVSWVCFVSSIPWISITFSCILAAVTLGVCSANASYLSTYSSWLDDSTILPNDCYLISHMNTLLRLLYTFAVLETILCPVCLVAFILAFIRRETTCTHAIWCFTVMAISTVVAAVVLVLKTVVLNSSLNMQAILSIRPDLSSGDVLASWDSFRGGSLSLVAFIFFLVTSGLHIVAVSARHLIPSPIRLPKQFRPFVMEKHKRTAASGDPEATTLMIEMVEDVDGPLARFYDHHDKQGLISTHIDLEVCQSSIAIICRCLHSLHRLLINWAILSSLVLDGRTEGGGRLWL